MATLAVIAAGALAAGASAYGASKSASAQAKASKKQAESQERINQAQIDWQKQLRGEGGSPTFLPFYSGDYESKTLWPSAQDAWTALNKTSAADQVAQYTEATSPYTQFLQGTMGDVMSGAWGNKRLATADPVYAARLAAAETPRSSIDTALNQRLNALKAQSALSGIQAGSSRARDEIASRMAAANQSANLRASANLQNAEQRYGIENVNMEEYLKLALQSPEIARQIITTMQMPETALSQNLANRMSVFSPFTRRESFGALPITSPQYQATLPVGAAIAQSLGTGISSGMSNYAQYQMLQDWMAKNQSGTPITTSNPSSGVGFDNTLQPMNSTISRA